MSFQPCKEEQLSDEEIITYSSAEDNEPDTWYPSECDFEDWKQGGEKKSEIKEESEQGYSIFQLISSY